MSRWVDRNAIINIGVVVLPALVGLVALRLLLDALGQTAMGMFTIALGLLGLSGILDFGLSRGLTRYVASTVAKAHDAGAESAVVALGLVTQAAKGSVFGLILWLALPILVAKLTAADVSLYQPTLMGYRWVVLSIPYALMSNGMLGVSRGAAVLPRERREGSYGLSTLYSADIGRRYE